MNDCLNLTQMIQFFPPNFFVCMQFLFANAEALARVSDQENDLEARLAKEDRPEKP